MGRPATDKKGRLVEAAMRRFHHHGVASTSLAAVAGEAGVPPGNVFYYFRSKEALTTAVIDRWCDRVGHHLADFAVQADPVGTIGAFLRSAEARRQNYADFGCPLAALGNDLRHGSTATAMLRDRPLAMIRAWLGRQFTLAIGDEGLAASHADFCFAALQGSFTLAHATADPRIVSGTVDHLIQWIDDLVCR